MLNEAPQDPGITAITKQKKAANRLQKNAYTESVIVALGPNRLITISQIRDPTQDRVNPVSSATNEGRLLMDLFANKFIKITHTANKVVIGAGIASSASLACCFEIITIPLYYYF